MNNTNKMSIITPDVNFKNATLLTNKNQVLSSLRQGCLFLMCADEIERIMDREGVFIEG